MDTRPISADIKTARVTLLAFARVRELMGAERLDVDVASGSTVRDLWSALLQRFPALASLQSSTRAARNGRVTTLDAELHDGDEVALLPPVGGG